MNVNTAAGTMSFDVIELLVGDAAVAAYHKDSSEDPKGPPCNLCGSKRPRPPTLPLYLSTVPFWLTLNKGQIIEICEQYRP